MDRNKNSIQMGYQCKNPFAFAKLLPLNIACKQPLCSLNRNFVCCLFILFYIFVSRSFPLPSAFLSTDIERGKVFGLNTLQGRKILTETACRPTFQLSRADVLPSQTSKGKGRMTESENSYISQIDDRPNQILSCNNEKCTVLLLVHKKVVPLFQDELYINANHASM